MTVLPILNPVRTLRTGLLAISVALPLLWSEACAETPTPSKFHGRDITGYALDYGFKLQDGKALNSSNLKFDGKVTMIFFGFTQCPMICPAAFSRAVEIKKLLGDEGGKLQVIFVTVDPDRDTSEIVRAFAEKFDSSFIGLRTTPENLKALSANFKFSYEKIMTGSSYTIDHSTTSYVFDPSGKIRVLFKHEATASDCADDIRALLHETSK